jgi:sortase A
MSVQIPAWHKTNRAAVVTRGTQTEGAPCDFSISRPWRVDEANRMTFSSRHAAIVRVASSSTVALHVVRGIQWISWSVGVALLLFCVAVLTAGELGRRADLENFTSAPTTALPDMSLWSARRVAEYQRTRQQLAAAPLAILRVPGLHLAVPIYPTATESQLNRGVGVIAGMAMPDRGGNLGLAGHRDGFCRVLKDISPDTVIEVETHLRVHRYRVTSIDIVDAADARLLAETDDPTITLVTCYPFYFVGEAPRRFIVRGTYLWPVSPQDVPT